MWVEFLKSLKWIQDPYIPFSFKNIFLGCQCNLETSVDNVCAVDDGKCTCKDNIAGHLCDESAECWWNFPNPEGNINFKEIKMLDKITYFLLFSECLCVDEGSEGCTCTEKEGICHCKPNIEGDKCDQCKPSYWSYPTCLGKHKYYFLH